MLSVESVSSIQIGSEREKVEDGGNSFSIGVDDFAIASLLEDINFDDFFAGIEDGELPVLELDAEMLVQLSSHVEEDSNQLNASPCASDGDSCKELEKRKEKVDDNLNLQGDESTVLVAASSDGESGRKPASSSNASRAKVPLGKRKVKVDWTPELHRRFVQAVEQLGVDKAVPSRILELMGVDCLTRHNIASHLQKYRSHRKHLLAREAEAANRSQRRQQLYSGGRREAFAGKREMAVPWAAPPPTIGFPPPPPGLIQHIRPLHVWGHPHRAVDQATPHLWPKHLVRPSSPSPPPSWMHAPSPYSDPTRPYWFPAHHHMADNHLTRGSPCYPMQPSPPTWFSATQVPGIPQKMYKQHAHLPIPTNQSDFRLQIDFHPSKESIDAAVEDVLAKPWLPLPLGLKPPSTESVLVELQRQGLSNVPPSSCA